MDREKVRKNSHKVPKFRDIYDEDLDWQEKVEIHDLRRKVRRKWRKLRNGFEKW